MIIDIFFVIKALSLAWFFTHFEPIVSAIGKLKTFLKIELRFILSPITCWKCCTFWFALIISGNIVIAAFASMLAYLIDKWVNSLKTYL